MTDNSLLCQLAFSMLPGINLSAATHILAAAGSPERFFEMPDTALAALTGLRSKIVSRQLRDSLLAKARAELEFVVRNRIATRFVTDAGYPKRLLECDDAPTMLFTLGEANPDARFVLSIVGTRHATPYGIDFTRTLIRDLAAMLPEKPLVVSGLAYGIDIAAHRAALEEGCPTAAVLAHGLRTIYPSQHRREAMKMVSECGLLVTEYCSDAPIHRGNFLARNRIVAGMADATLVVESAEKGGALVTARIAGAYSREVMALPGRINDPYSSGCNRLIARNAASLVASAADVVNLMGWPAVKKEGEEPALPLLTDEEQQMVDYLRQHPDATLNKIAIDLGVPIGQLMSRLVDMEFKELVLCCPGSRYRLR